MYQVQCTLEGSVHGSDYVLLLYTHRRFLQSEIDANPDNYLEPTGFVFHMSRCGSTLAANLMGSSPYNLVYSESKPPAQLMSVCDTVGCSQDQRVRGKHEQSGYSTRYRVLYRV